MLDFLSKLFDTSDFPARWHCGNWTAAHGWLHVLSDLGVWSAYVAIPCVLGYFVLRRKDIPFRTVFWLFGAFILACGTTHLMEAIIFWWPAYRLAGVIKLLTAVASWATVIALVPTVPKVLAMRSPDELEREIEERKRTEASLRQSEERFRLIVEGVKDYAIFMLDPQGAVVTWRGGAGKLYGYTPEEIVGQHFARFYTEEANQRGWPNEMLRLAAEGRIEDEGWRVRKDGSRFWANVVLTALRDEGGRLVGFSKITRDLSERKRAEDQIRQARDELEIRVRERTAELARTNEALQAEIVERRRVEEELRRQTEELRESENRFRGTFEQAAVGMAHIDLEGRWLRVNQRLCDIVGYSREELLQRTFQDITHPDDLETDLGLFRRLKEGAIPNYAIEKRYLHKQGPAVWINLTVALLRDASGTPRSVIKVVEDIGQRKQAEEAVREASRCKDEFLMMLAHELRNPIAPIRNGLQVMKLSANDGQAIEQTRAMMERQLGHLSRIVDDLLDVSRLTTGKVALRPERLDLARLVRVAAEDQRPAFEKAGLEFGVEVPDVPLWVTGDPTRLTQVIDNLLQNAAKFTDRGGRVRVRLAADREQQQAALTVSDTGVGIEPDMVPRLFQVFSQADRSLDRNKGGLGLGLAIVKKLVELHSGQVRASSAGPGKGAEFVVALRMEEEPAALTQIPAGSGRAKKGLRILVVEDNQDSADSLRMMLELYGYEVVVAYTGPAGVEKAETWLPDVVLCDIGLPGLDGFGVASALRRNPATAQARMIAVTGYGNDEDCCRCQNVGFDLHLKKPVEPDVLLAALTGVTC